MEIGVWDKIAPCCEWLEWQSWDKQPNRKQRIQHIWARRAGCSGQMGGGPSTPGELQVCGQRLGPCPGPSGYVHLLKCSFWLVHSSISVTEGHLLQEASLAHHGSEFLLSSLWVLPAWPLSLPLLQIPSKAFFSSCYLTGPVVELPSYSGDSS